MDLFPRQVKVGAHRYGVLFPYLFQERTDICGQCDNSSAVILLTPVDQAGVRRASSKIVEAFWHEVLHAIDETYNGGGIEESTMRRLSEGLAQVLADNFHVTAKGDTAVETVAGEKA